MGWQERLRAARLPNIGTNDSGVPATVGVVLSGQELRNFASNGYVLLRNVIPEHLLVAADAEIDGVVSEDPPPPGTVGHHFYFLSPERLPAADAALRSSPALHLAEEFVRPYLLDHGLEHIQIALNIPPYQHRPGGPHLDGHRPEQDRPRSFSMLAAIFLCDESVPDSGNLWVWPGSHLAHQRLLGEQGVGALLPVSGHPLSLDQPPQLAAPHPILARRGDLLLAHFLLGQNIGGNLSTHTRRILYYRLSCADHDKRWADTFLDAFTEYRPVRDASRYPAVRDASPSELGARRSRTPPDSPGRGR